MRPLISVVIPVYKVENELPACIESVINQTYENLEILLVDDGSPDCCGDICDEYAKKDSRIKVFHKVNGGLSDARNYGIKRTTGDYITCVDSDDVIKDNFISTMLELIERYDADLAVSPYQKFIDINDLYENVPIETSCLAAHDALAELLYQNKVFHTGAHCKLYKRELFEGIEYPVGLYYEDLATTYKLLGKSKRIASTSQKMYGYRIRKESIMRQGYSPKMLSCLPVSEQLFRDITKLYPDLKYAAASRAFSVNRAIYWQIPSSNVNERKKVWKKIKQFRGIVIKDKKARRRERLMALLSYLGSKLFMTMAFLYRRQQMRV